MKNNELSVKIVVGWNPNELFKQKNLSISILTVGAYINKFMDINIIKN